MAELSGFVHHSVHTECQPTKPRTPRLRMRGAIPPIRSKSQWRGA